jgi:hypothetical protein
LTTFGYTYVTVCPKGRDLELALWKAGSSDPTGWSRNWNAGTTSPIALRVRDCSNTFEELKFRVARFSQELKVHTWNSAAFSDLDGNLPSVNQFNREQA